MKKQLLCISFITICHSALACGGMDYEAHLTPEQKAQLAARAAQYHQEYEATRLGLSAAQSRELNKQEHHKRYQRHLREEQAQREGIVRPASRLQPTFYSLIKKIFCPRPHTK